MKHLLLILSLCLAACSTTPEPLPPPPKGPFLITSLDTNGKARESYVAETYKMQKFPPKVTFSTQNGQQMTVSGSFRIQQYNTP